MELLQHLNLADILEQLGIAFLIVCVVFLFFVFSETFDDAE